MTTTSLSKEAQRMVDLANNNLKLLEGKCQNKEEIQNYYLGILRRHAIILSDLRIILNNRNPEFITTPFILLRSLLDDFLHLLYLELYKEPEKKIIEINADTYKKNFAALEDLTKSNYKHFHGKYPFYLTNEQYQENLNLFSEKKGNEKYFEDNNKSKFKKFMTLTQMVDGISHSRDVEIFKDRAFFLWKVFSSFIHYSNYSFDCELRNDKENLNMIDESFQYCYNSIYLAFKYFERNLGLEFMDDEYLRKKHGIIYEC